MTIIGNMNSIIIDTDEIQDWDSFHDCFARTFGFPDFYGRNMNAWIDCMSSLDCPEDGMSTVHAEPGKTVVLELKNMGSLAERNNEIYEAIIECSAFVNYRKLEVGEPAVLTLSFWRKDT